MPLYEYKCESCSHRFERIQKFSDPPVDTCPQCGGEVRKLLSSPAIQFKGSGWYITDYARKDSGKESGSKSGKSDSGKSESSDSSASDTKKAADSGGSKTESSTPAKPSTD